MNRNGIERRKYPRVGINGLVKLVSLNSKEIYGSLLDISEGGFRIFTAGTVSLRHHYSFMFKVDNSVILGYGEIVHINKNEYMGIEGNILGIRFIEVNPINMQRIRKYVYKNDYMIPTIIRNNKYFPAGRHTLFE